MEWIRVSDAQDASTRFTPAYDGPGIIATTLGHDSFKYYMLGPAGINAPLTGMSNILALPG